jgi:hypothetical protein
MIQQRFEGGSIQYRIALALINLFNPPNNTIGPGQYEGADRDWVNARRRQRVIDIPRLPDTFANANSTVLSVT